MFIRSSLTCDDKFSLERITSVRLSLLPLHQMEAPPSPLSSRASQLACGKLREK